MKCHNPFPFPADYLDNGFWIVAARDARKLCGGNLPAIGHEKLVDSHTTTADSKQVRKVRLWVARSFRCVGLRSVSIWTVREASSAYAAETPEAAV